MINLEDELWFQWYLEKSDPNVPWFWETAAGQAQSLDDSWFKQLDYAINTGFEGLMTPEEIATISRVITPTQFLYQFWTSNARVEILEQAGYARFPNHDMVKNTMLQYNEEHDIFYEEASYFPDEPELHTINQ